jgi:hypothetical protein
MGASETNSQFWNFCHRPSCFTPILGHTTHLNPVFGRTIQFEPRFEALVQWSDKKPKLSQFLGEKLSPKICFKLSWVRVRQIHNFGKSPL